MSRRPGIDRRLTVLQRQGALNASLSSFTVAATGTSASSSNWRTQVSWNSWWGETFVSSGGAISQWTDGSGNGRHFVQATGANKPAVGGAGFNSKPWASFNGTTQLFTCASAMSTVVTAAAGYMAAAVNATSVDNSSSDFNNQAIITDSAGEAGITFSSTQAGGGAGPPPSLRGYVYDGSDKSAPSVFDTAKVKIVEVWWDSTNVYSRVNGGATASTPAGAVQSVTGTLICGANYQSLVFFHGGCAALACISSVPTLSDRNAIAAAMISEFGAT